MKHTHRLTGIPAVLLILLPAIVGWVTILSLIVKGVRA